MLRRESLIPASRLVSAVTEGFPFHARPADQAIFLCNALECLGASQNYKVSRGLPGRQSSDLALDLTWWEPGWGTVLVAGCEWGVAGDVAAAFTNLMTIKAPTKLLIFRTREAGAEREDILLRTDIDAVLKALGAAILDFSQHLEGEHYVLLERLEAQSTFRSYEFRVPVDGRLALEFKEAAQVFQRCEAGAAITLALTR